MSFNHFFEDSNGRLWLGGSNGLVYFDNEKFYYFEDEFQSDTHNDSLQIDLDIKVLDINEDSQKRVWIGSNLGAFVCTADSWKHFSNQDLGIEIADEQHIVEDFNGKIWIHTLKVKKLPIRFYITKINPENWNLEPVPLNKINNGKYVGEIYADSDRSIWFFSGRNGITKYSQ